MNNYEFTNSENANITIITLTYNSSKNITKCIQSIIKASKFSEKLKVCHIVIDGISQDNTINLIKQVSPSSLVFSRQPAGIYDALNYAISLVESPYVMYVHSDDEIDKYFLLQMLKKIEVLQENQQYILYGTVDFIDKNSNILFSRKPPFFISAIKKYAPMIMHPNAIYSTDLEKLHPYNVNSGLSADQEHINEIAHQAILIRVPSAKYRFRMSSASSTIRKWQSSTNKKFIHHIFTWSLPRMYIRLFETKLVKRFFMKLKNKSYWILDE